MISQISKRLIFLATLLALAGAAVFGSPGLANAMGNCADNCQQNGHHHNHHGAPGPVAGAGLPILALGYGVYCLIKRRRKAK
jgi:hypothetical protein